MNTPFECDTCGRARLVNVAWVVIEIDGRAVVVCPVCQLEMLLEGDAYAVVR
jgi:transcription elongation factor Elf1